jgi:NAD(P)-dependent dehydrogenase (short-subunit alcohol dehydrogenase family)
MTGTILLVGASRGLGLGLAREYLDRGWQVIATARSAAPELQALMAEADGRLVVEQVDIMDDDNVAALRDRLAGRKLDVVFLVAGIGGPVVPPIHEVFAEQAGEVYLTNAYAPVVCAEALAGLVVPGGVVAFMSSMLGSLGRANEFEGMEAYRASKAALNMLARIFARRHGSAFQVLCLAPGWVRTDMGGPNAPLDVVTSVRGLADTIAQAHDRQPGDAAFFNYNGQEMPW